jgi:hypothetical protein
MGIIAQLKSILNRPLPGNLRTMDEVREYKKDLTEHDEKYKVKKGFLRKLDDFLSRPLPGDPQSREEVEIEKEQAKAFEDVLAHRDRQEIKNKKLEEGEFTETHQHVHFHNVDPKELKKKNGR